MMCLGRLLRRTAVVLALLWWGGVGVARADVITYNVTVSSSVLNGLDGVLEFQLAPNTAPGTDVITSVVQNFTGGTLSGPTMDTLGNVTGSLNALPPLTLDDGAGLAIADQSVHFSSTFSFQVSLSGNLPSPAPGASLYVLIFDPTFTTTYLSGNNFSNNIGQFLQIDVTGGPPVVTATDAGGVNAQQLRQASPTPEPSTVLLLGVGVVSFAGYRRWWKRR